MKEMNLRVVTLHGIKGYLLTDIKKELTHEEFEDFMEFIFGQTVMRCGEDTFIYKHDFERWRR